MFKGYATTNRSHSCGYYSLGEVIPIEKDQASMCYKMVKNDGSTCIVPPSCIYNIVERNDQHDKIN